MWTYNSVFYQIYPIGFCGAPVHNDGVTVPRIRKIMEWSDYLKDLGVDSILLNPIFDSDNHGYDTRDFRKIDCRLGTNEDFSDVARICMITISRLYWTVCLIMSAVAFGHFVMSRKRNGTLHIRIGSTLVLMVTVVITMGSGMKDGRGILNWSN